MPGVQADSDMETVEVKSEEVTSPANPTTNTPTSMAIKKHTIDAILGLPRLGCLQQDQLHQEGRSATICA